MFIVALVIAVPLLALVLAVLVRDVRDDGYGHRADSRSIGTDTLPSVGTPAPAAQTQYRASMQYRASLMR